MPVDLKSLSGREALRQIQALKKAHETGDLAWGVALSYQTLCVIEEALEIRKKHRWRESVLISSLKDMKK